MFVVGCTAAFAQRAGRRNIDRELPPPDAANLSYGSHERNVLDLWLAEQPGRRPLVIYFHGGGFRQGDKRSLSPFLLEECRRRGISVAAANYRYAWQAPFPAPMHDGGRAIQFLRANARKWHLDSKLFAATGGSAGAGISLWLGFHEDLADAKAEDPIARESTRLTAMAVSGAQSTYDIPLIRDMIGGRAWEHPALLGIYGITADEIESPKAQRLYDEAAPIKHLTADDPPVFLFYYEPKKAPPADAPVGKGIHHPRFGAHLGARLDELGIDYINVHRDEYLARGLKPDDVLDAVERDMVAFLSRQFEIAGNR